MTLTLKIKKYIRVCLIGGGILPFNLTLFDNFFFLSLELNLHLWCHISQFPWIQGIAIITKMVRIAIPGYCSIFFFDFVYYYYFLVMKINFKNYCKKIFPINWKFSCKIRPNEHQKINNFFYFLFFILALGTNSIHNISKLYPFNWLFSCKIKLNE